jgi:protein-tyrosine-phosphatase
MNNEKTKNNLTENTAFLDGVEQYMENIQSDVESIPDIRKEQLEEVAAYVKEKSSAIQDVQMTFICTHNSRRSHMSQVWAQTAAHYYQIPNVQCYSGGTEATAFNPRAVKAMKKAGFNIEKTGNETNPVYLVSYSNKAEPLQCFSKKFEDDFNPQTNFAAIMTCSQADEGCPFVPGAEVRFSIPYEDPKVADDTPEEEAKYDERCRQIATEMFYLFSKV